MPFQCWTALTRGEQKHDTITRCPGAHIHPEYHYLTVRFQCEEFLVLAHMLADAVAHLQGISLKMANYLTVSKSYVTF